MSQVQSQSLPLSDDPFTILKNHRKKFIRPKAKYIRKVPVPPRKKKTEVIDKYIEGFQYKNSRKMTADSEIEQLLENPCIDSLIQIPNFEMKVSVEQDRFFDQLVELDFVLPLEENGQGNRQFMMEERHNPHFIDFFTE